MESRIKELIIGYDLCDDYVQMSCYNQKSKDIDTIYYVGEKMMDRIPTVLCRLYDSGAWLYGYEAWRAINEKRGAKVTHFVRDVEEEPTVDVDGDTYSKTELMQIYIEESLKLITKYYPHWKVGFLTVTVKHLNREMVQAIKGIAGHLGVEADRIAVQNHVSSYEHYALNQKKELWQHDVGLFDYSGEGMTYYHLNISRKRTPPTVSADVTSFKEYFDGSEIGKASPPELDRRFLEVVRQATAKRIISTVYLTGEGFEGDWAKISLKNLCNHRRGFIGSNIFARGACYQSLRYAGVLEKNAFVALNEDVVAKTLYIRGSRYGKMENVELVSAGEEWYRAEGETAFILDGAKSIRMNVQDYLTRRERWFEVPLEGFELRKDKTNQLSLRMEFDDASHCHIFVEDKGFGEFYPASGKVWEYVADIYDESYSDREAPEIGRLIFTAKETNQVPYYFNLSGMKVYTLEELCYYVYHHIYAVSEDTFDDELFYWLESALKERLLARHLREARKQKRTLKDHVKLLMNAAGYYTAKELEALYHTIEEIEAQNPMESQKVEADNYMRYGRPLEALRVYKKVQALMEAEDSMATREFKANVWHNTGVAFARLANMTAAEECFHKAFELDGSPASREAWMLSLKMIGDAETLKEESGKMMLPPDVMAGMDSKYGAAGEKFRKERTDRAAAAKRLQDDGQWEAAEHMAEEYIEQQKAVCRNI